MTIVQLRVACAIAGFAALALALISMLCAGLILLAMNIHRERCYHRWGVSPDDERDEQVILLHLVLVRPELRSEVEDFFDRAADAATATTLLIGWMQKCLQFGIFCLIATFALSSN